MGILSWIIVGGLAGWLASMVMGTNERQGCIMDVILGIVGALVGGFLLSLIGFDADVTGIDIGSILTAFIGAVVVLFIYKQVTGRRA